MKVAFLIRSLGSGGAERQLVELARGLRSSGDDVAVYVYYSDDTDLERALATANVRLVPLNKAGRWDFAPFLFRLVRRMREQRPDVILAYLVSSNLLATVVAPMVGRPPTVWGVRASNMDLSRYDWLARVTFAATCLMSRFADLIIANSHAGRAYHIAAGYPVEKTVVVQNGIDTQCFQRDDVGRFRVRSQWAVPDDATLIGMVARLDPMKDHPLFLRAAHHLAASKANVWFVCVGDGPPEYRRELAHLSESLGLKHRIVWAGLRSDLPAVYSALDLFTLTSAWGEGFPNVLAEAMACGVPVVATDVGDAASILGPCGVVVPGRDPSVLADAWKAMLDRRGCADASGGRARVLEYYSTAKLVAVTAKLLQQVHRNGMRNASA